MASTAELAPVFEERAGRKRYAASILDFAESPAAAVAAGAVVSLDDLGVLTLPFDPRNPCPDRVPDSLRG
jgi:hypothetical protein